MNIEISPAILTADPEVFREKLLSYQDLPTNQIDIDIAEASFVGNDLLGVDQVLEIIAKVKPKLPNAFHLMLAHPETAISKIREQIPEARIYIHLESDYKAISDTTNFGLAVKAETKLPSLKELAGFGEIQLMTGEVGKQGSTFLFEVLDKVTELKGLGYTGKISLDGGVNLRIAEELQHWEIDRVSVGSYFQKSSDPSLAFMKLQLALNMREE